MRIFFTLIIISIFGVGVINAQNEPILTGHESFETWVDAEKGQLPEYFNGTNMVVVAGFVEVETVTEGTSDSQDGDSHVVMTGKDIQGTTIPGVITQGTMTIDMANSTVDITGGVPYTTRSARMKGFFKYTPANNDTAVIAAWLLKGSTSDTIAVGAFKVVGTYDTWTEFTFDLEYNSNEYPDTLNFLCSSSITANNAQLGSVFEIDNVWFEGEVTSINNVVASNDFVVSPNPANGYFNLKMSNANNTTVKVHNTVGQVVITKTFNTSSINERFDISDLNKGIYFVEVIDNGTSKIKKLVIR